jgi:hypothetical protein
MKKTLLGLIKYSLLPALLLFIGKLLGILFVAGIFKISVEFSLNDYNIFFFKTSVVGKDLLTLSSYSDLFMFLTIVLGMSIILFRAVVLHDSHISSKTVFKLAKYNLLDLIGTSFELYHSGVIWLVFTWVSSILILLNCIKGSTYVWVLFVAVVFSIFFSIIFARDLISEINLSNDESKKRL